MDMTLEMPYSTGLKALREVTWMRLIDADPLKTEWSSADAKRGEYTAYHFIESIQNAPTAKPSKFHVIDKQTGKEADPYEIALHEDWAKELCYCDMEGFAIGEDGTLYLIDECGRHEYADKERFEVVWDD